jgi:L,D-transpeptidase YcbB
MIRTNALALALLLAGTLNLVTDADADTIDAPRAEPSAVDVNTPARPSAAAANEDPVARALRERLMALTPPVDDEKTNEQEALGAFYAARSYRPAWIAENGLNPRAQAIVAEIGKAADWGLDPADFELPRLASTENATDDLSPGAIADAELTLMQAVLKYARFARGGRIINPTELLTSQLDRRPQLMKPANVLDGITAAADTGNYLRELHPPHPQFEKLRKKYLATRVRKGKRESATARRLLANMEMWRWMPIDLGYLHVLANVPEFMMRYYENGEVVHSERVVAGEVGKQTTIFTRPLKNIVLRPMWRVPESIKVLELWPSLKRGGGLMRQYGLALETKDGKPLDWREIDWNEEDIRSYEVIQPPGRKSVMGVVKFSFPSQHTIFMHDTPDKWMFNSKRRTLSHGCLRLRNPLRFAEIVLAKDKGWDAQKVRDLAKSGPLDNKIKIDRRIGMHLVYFTARVSDRGKLKRFPDVYGHEKRVRLALAGKWSKIDKGRDHLKPVEPVKTTTVARRQQRHKPDQSAFDDFMSGMFGGF